jgi:PAT family beta-lactamase induction signal transducer AmpG
MKGKDAALRTKLLVVAVLYFAEGVPYGFINTTMTNYLRKQGMPLEQIGILSLLGFAWSLKLLWAPLVDRFGSRAAWIVPSQIACALGMIAITWFQVPPAPLGFWILMGLLCLASATQDIAIDAYTIDILETSELGLANGVRNGAYRVALIAAGGGLIMLSAWMSWSAAFIAVAVIMIALALTIITFAIFHQPRPALQHPNQESLSARGQIRTAIQGLVRLPHFWAIILFTLFFKFGDALMGKTLSAFWVDQGFSQTEIGLISSTLGPVATILGAMIGGWVTSRWGIAPGLWILGTLQAVSNLGYWVAAWPGMWRYTTYIASQMESFTGGMGAAAFMAFLMSLCDKRFSATHYAFFSMLFAFSSAWAGYLGFWGAARWGYAPFFFYTFLAALPAFALFPWILPLARQFEHGKVMKNEEE